MGKRPAQSQLTKEDLENSDNEVLIVLNNAILEQ